MELKRCIGGCVTPFLIAFLFDVLGLILVFVGIFANVRIGDRFYGDFLIYSGSLIIFFSLAFWLMWYVGNVQVSEDDEGGLKKSSSIVQLARKLSERLSQKLKGEPRVKCVEDGSQVGPHKASRVTWGRSTAYHNKGYDDCLDSPSTEKKVEIEPEEKTEM
ncbi:transmembrane protein 238 like [Sander vitreus]